MAYRFPTDRKEDKALFARTANVGKKINLSPVSMRGGYRL